MTDARYLLVKRGLYYRPNNNGYTGIKEHAGRYRDVDALGLDSVTAIHEDEAPEYSAACFEDLKCAHMQARIAALIEERDQLKSIIASVEDAMLRDEVGVTKEYGWNITKLNKLRPRINAALQPEHLANLSASNAELIAQAQPLELPEPAQAALKPTKVFPSPKGVGSIPDEELLARAVRGARKRKGRVKQARWIAVMDLFLLGSTYAHLLCARFGLDPDEVPA